MQEILKRQNEHKMLEIQFAAKFLFNIAEKSNSLATYLALIPLLCLIPYPDSWAEAVTTIAVIVDLLVIALIAITRQCVNNAADLRAHFDAYVLHASKSKLHNKLQDLVYQIVRTFSKQAEPAMSNTGLDTPPGVKNWYGLKNANNYIDAVVKCLNENRWWDKKLNIHRIIRTTTFLAVTIALTAVLIFAVGVKWYLVLLAVIQLILRLGERLITNIKYFDATKKLEGAYDMLENSPTKKNLIGVQKAIDTRRHIPVLGSNKWHKKKAHNLSEEYENTIA